jgi:manganese/zinc/iron transport system permease protein
MAGACGLLFLFAFLFAPRRGLLAQGRRRAVQRLDLGVRMLVVHLLHHQDTEAAEEECSLPRLHHHLLWSLGRTQQVVREAERRTLVERSGELLRATDAGRRLAEAAITGEILILNS